MSTIDTTNPMPNAQPAPSRSSVSTDAVGVELEALREMHRKEHSKLGELLLDKTSQGVVASNWQGGRVNGIGEGIIALKRLAALRPAPPQQEAGTAFERIRDGLDEAATIARGEQPAAAIWHNGHRYVPSPATLADETLRAEVEPVAMRFRDEDGSYQYLDEMCGRGWQNWIEDAEPLYANPTPDSPYSWHEAKWVAGSAVARPSIMLMEKTGPCIGIVQVMCCDDDAVRVDVLRALGAASNPAKLRRFIDAARRGEQEANERAEAAEAKLAALAQPSPEGRQAEEVEKLHADREAVWYWIRQPDWADDFSQRDLLKWLEQRPSHLTAPLRPETPEREKAARAALSPEPTT